VLEFMGDRHVAVVREVTKKFEQVERGAASAVRDRLNARAQRGEYVLVVAGTTYQAGIEALARDH